MLTLWPRSSKSRPSASAATSLSSTTKIEWIPFTWRTAPPRSRRCGTEAGGGWMCAGRGKRTVNCEPFLSPWLVAFIVPPCSSTSCRVRGRPTPTLNLEERFKNPLKHILWDAYAVVGDGYDRRIALLFCTELYRTVRVGVLCRVVKQVDYYLLEPYRVRLQIQVVLRLTDRERVSAASDERLRHAHGAVYNRIHGERLLTQGQFIVRNTRDVEQVVQHDCHGADAVVYGLEQRGGVRRMHLLQAKELGGA